ncbi:MAG: IS200/IS605 family transposase [Sulfurovum sp.]|nr:IS200/IS605 family transposase [Sulfurovum sp.]
MRSGSHTISQLQVHIVWVTKYRYHVLKGDVQKRCRDLIVQVCDAEDIRILKGVVSKDHVHMHIEYPPSLSISDIVKKLKGRTSRKLQMEFKELSKRYWGKHFWAIGYGVWSTGNVTQDMVDEYLEHHRNPSNKDLGTMILE